jgi:cytochrome c oxidase subunit 1
VALTFIGAAYRLVPSLARRRLFAPQLALLSEYLWFAGMVVMSTAMHWAGLLGAPRRTSDVSYFGAAGAASWHGQMVGAALGGTLVALGVLFFVIVATGTYFTNRREEDNPALAFAPVDTSAGPTPPVLDKLGRWAALAIVLAVLAYAGPMTQQLTAHTYLAPGMRTW